MKRCVCTVATGLLLALVSTGTATANGLPLPGQDATQVTSFGDQTVGEQKNNADVNQYQGNGNVNVSPAVAVFGDAKTTNYQGNGSEADATVAQSNEANQSQSSTQKQYLDQSDGRCCGGQSQTGEQKTDFGDQSVGEQRNDADVNQYQGNGNVNVSPAIAIFGDAKTTNKQGNWNEADASVDQSNSVDQSQSSYQKQSLDQDTGCCGGQSQTGTQKVYGGDQTVGKQKNEADVDQYQGNGNVNISPAIAIGRHDGNPCSSKCERSWSPSGGEASTTNYQGNGNSASADVDQSNSVDQSQWAKQKQTLYQHGGDCGCRSSHDSQSKHEGWKPECSCAAPGQTGVQKVYGGDQTVEKQKNDADVTQNQGNGNGSLAPALALGGKERGSCYSKCEAYHPSAGGNAETTNKQGNWNEADASVDQSNSVDQWQSVYQRQFLANSGKGLVYRR